MRFGAPIDLKSTDPVLLAREHVRLGYTAAYAPGYLTLEDTASIRAAEKAFADENILIAEVGAWCNPLDPDEEKAKKAREYVKTRLALADELGARNCVNVLGSFNPDAWAGSFPEGYEPVFFDACVQTYREIIDAVKPVRAKMSFEMMPYYFLDGPEEYDRLLTALDRKEAGLHLDLCNCISSPRLYWDNAGLIRRAFRVMRGRICSCHLKDLKMYDEGYTVQFREVPMGQGNLDLRTYLACACADPDPDLPVMLEHLKNQEQYLAAAARVREAMADLQEDHREDSI